jgi:site-specific DNA recombinase
VHRFNADELENAIGEALLDFYTTGHDIIARGMNDFLNAFDNSTSKYHDELAAIKKELKENSAATDRYLTAFEKGNLDSDDPEIRRRLTALRDHAKTLKTRKVQLEYDLETPPVVLREADQARIRRYIHRIITDTDHKAKKTLFEALVDVIDVESDGSVIPTFKVPATHLATGVPVEDQLICIPAQRRPADALDSTQMAPAARIHAISAGTVTVTPVGQRKS